MAAYHPYSIFPLGDEALLVDFGNEISEELNEKVMRMFSQLRLNQPTWVRNLVPAFSSITIHYDLWELSHLKLDNETAFDFVARHIEELPLTEIANAPTRKLHRIPVCYEKPFAVDLKALSEATGIAEDEIIALHSANIYKVYMNGFLPGFAYLGGLDPRIAAQRKRNPVMVAKGSVGIGGSQTGIYPVDATGGWHIIGVTPLSLFDPGSTQPILLEPGDSVQFYSIKGNEFKNYQERNS